MHKNLFQDMVKAKNNKLKKQPTSTPASASLPIQPKKPLYKKDDQKKSRHALWFVAVLTLVFLVFSVSTFFSHADIKITPKEKDFNVQNSFTAIKDVSSDTLSFDTVVLSGAESKNLQAMSTIDVSIKATGTVVLYNAFSATPQKLKIDTRLEGSNGKLYKTKIPVTIPSLSSSGLPGSVEVEVYADVAGSESNSGPIDFKIFGFKGSPKYEKMYGRSKGSIAGGFVGPMPQISDADKNTAQEELKNTLKIKLTQKVLNELPAGFILFPDAIFVDFNPEISVVDNKDNSATMSIKGTLSGIIFNENKLSQMITNTLLDKEEKTDAYISNIKNLNFSLINKDGVSVATSKNISFDLKGSAKAVWKVDTDAVLHDLLNSNKKDFNAILSKYSNVTSADLALRPAWKSTLPEKIEKINISVNYPK
ncbi:MAG: hypothetical protein V4504_00130 [Patescibacteria group bacterium]